MCTPRQLLLDDVVSGKGPPVMDIPWDILECILGKLGILVVFMAEPALRQKRAEPFGQRASAHVHVHAGTP